MPSSRRSSQTRDQTCVSCVSCIAGGFFTTEPPEKPTFQSDVSLFNSVTIQRYYVVIDYIFHTVHFRPMTHLFCN